jgi:hypothetical protein
MAPDQDPWASGGDATRAEVRDIFARHAERSAEAGSAGVGTDERRRSALPGVLLLPARIWQILPAAGKAGVAALFLALAVALALLLPPAFENASENRADVRRAEAAKLEQIRRQLIRDQRPRRAVVPVPVSTGALAAVVAEDFERRVRAGQLEGPAGPTTCRPVRPQREPGTLDFTCIAERGAKRGVYLDRELVSGYRFRGRVDRATGAAAWCKQNPQPLHADQEEFVVVALSRACIG